MIRVEAYEYILQEKVRRESAKPRKPAGKGFSEVLRNETKRLEEEEMEKTIKVALTVPEIRMMQDLMDQQATEYEYSWQKNIAESLNKKLNDLKKDLFMLRMQHATNQLDNPMQIAAVKKDIARIKTIIREKETNV